MDVFWLEQTDSDLPADDLWLSAAERLCLSGMRFPKRRRDWRLGRWTAKHSVAGYLGIGADRHALAGIEVRAASSGAPQVFFDGRRAALEISITHSNGRAACAVAPAHAGLGCDLELIEPRSQAFLSDYFTTEEQELAAGMTLECRPVLATLLWSAKESALKALHTGLWLDTRDVSVTPIFPPACSNRSSVSGVDWCALEVRCRMGQMLQGWWNCDITFVRTLVSTTSVAPPITLGRAAGSESSVLAATDYSPSTRGGRCLAD